MDHFRGEVFQPAGRDVSRHASLTLFLGKGDPFLLFRQDGALHLLASVIVVSLMNLLNVIVVFVFSAAASFRSAEIADAAPLPPVLALASLQLLHRIAACNGDNVLNRHDIGNRNLTSGT